MNLQGFLDMRMKSWVRNLITRVIAIAPSLIVSIVSGPSGAGKLIVFSSVSDSVTHWDNWIGALMGFSSSYLFLFKVLTAGV